MATKRRMAELLERLCDLLQKDGACTSIKGGRPLLFPPANDREIRVLEERTGRKVPPSYVEFLKATNGMVGDQGLFTFIGTSGKHTDKALKDIEKRRKWIGGEWEEEHGKASEGSIAVFEKKMNLKKETEDEAHVFAGNKFIFATDFLGSLFYFLDASGKSSDPGVIWRDNQGGIVAYDSFRGMLERRIKVLEARTANAE